jgi:hypothetical protein
MQFLKSLFATARIVHLESLSHQCDSKNAAGLGSLKMPGIGGIQAAGICEEVLRRDREIFELASRKDFSVAMLTAKLRNAVDGCE